MSEKYDLRTVAEGAVDAWDTAMKSHRPILRDYSDALIQAADELDRLQAIVDRQESALRYLHATYYTATFDDWLAARVEAAEKARTP